MSHCEALQKTEPKQNWACGHWVPQLPSKIMGLEVCKLHFPGSFGSGLPVRFCLTGRAIKMRKEKKCLCFPFPFSVSLCVSLSFSSLSALSHFSFFPSFLPLLPSFPSFFHCFSFWGCGPLSMILGSGNLISDLPSALLFRPLTF